MISKLFGWASTAREKMLERIIGDLRVENRHLRKKVRDLEDNVRAYKAILDAYDTQDKTTLGHVPARKVVRA